nr:MAG TPA: Nse4 C-terminal [Caudoviricetes sp.]
MIIINFIIISFLSAFTGGWERENLFHLTFSVK